jgi:putative colanic acid biosynthesis glycosyltransferase
LPKLLQITIDGNTGSTGKIAEAIGELAIANGWVSYIAHAIHPRPSKSLIITIGSKFDFLFHVLLTRVFDRHGLGSKRATIKLVRQIKEIKPDIIQLHHLHGYYINIKVLFEFLSKETIPIVWIFHDCWSVTGHCAHFDFVGCEKWKTECNQCPQKRDYPASLFVDRSRKNFKLKKELFTSISNLTIVSVSNWLNTIVKASFLGSFHRKVIYNGIDTEIFTPLAYCEKVKSELNIPGKFLILGVAGVWGPKKGLYDFFELSKRIDKNDQILIVGLTKDQLKNLPSNIIGLPLIEDHAELSKLFATADVYMNLSVEETFGLTTAESLSCGTPAIVYNATACPEIIDSDTGIIVDKNNITSLIEAIETIKKNGKEFYSDACRSRAINLFDKNERFREYIKLYEQLISKKVCLKKL